jgi:hypothetical protein
MKWTGFDCLIAQMPTAKSAPSTARPMCNSLAKACAKRARPSSAPSKACFTYIQVIAFDGYQRFTNVEKTIKGWPFLIE